MVRGAGRFARLQRVSIRIRLMLGAALVLLFFVAAAGLAVQRAHADSVLAARYAQLQGTVYLLLAEAELDAEGLLVMPPAFTEPRLGLPGSGLYAHIADGQGRELWRSPSAVGLVSAASPPWSPAVPVGEWRSEQVSGQARGKGLGRGYLRLAYGVRWSVGAREQLLMLSVLEDRAALDRELAAFVRTLWAWLGGAALLLLASQTLLLTWGLLPLRRVAQEIRAVEDGAQDAVSGTYPAEVALLTDNLNTLIRQERQHRTRYREALSFLAHSLKTPLAVLRSAQAEPERLPAVVDEQVAHMDGMVQYQLGRAAAMARSRFVPAIALLPVALRIRESLRKVYADKGLDFGVEGPADLAWRLDEGDALELFGNLMDNAAKWARSRVAVRLWREAGELHLQVDDDGPGFGEQDAILQLHVRGDERVPGHGVGLAVVKDLVAQHDGELRLLRAELGGGRVDIVLRPA